MRSLEGTSTGELNSFEKRAKARAFAELVAFIDTALEEVIMCLNWLICMNCMKVNYNSLE